MLTVYPPNPSVDHGVWQALGSHCLPLIRIIRHESLIPSPPNVTTPLRLHIPKYRTPELRPKATHSKTCKFALAKVGVKLSSLVQISTIPTDHHPTGYIISNAEDLLSLFSADYGILVIGEGAKILGPNNIGRELLIVAQYLRMKQFTWVS